MTHPTASRLFRMGMHRRAAQTRPIYRVTQCLNEGHTAEVSGSEIATTVSTWLAELGADTPLVEDLALAVWTGNWSAVHAIGDYLSVDVTMAA